MQVKPYLNEDLVARRRHDPDHEDHHRP